ncbi:MAG: hypothetical protein ACR2HQ_08545, partial [Ilumatobacteraceae bacterium]
LTRTPPLEWRAPQMEMHLEGDLVTGEPIRGRLGATQIGGLASVGAGAVHAAAAGIHAEHPTLARLFVAVAAAQLAVGLVLLLRPGRLVAGVVALVNLCAVSVWVVTRLTGISWIGGLEQSEDPQFADIVCATLGVVAVVGAVLALRRASSPAGRGLGLAVPSLAVGAIAVAAMLTTAAHGHSSAEAAGGHGAAGAGEVHGDGEGEAAESGEEVAAVAGDETTTTAHEDDHEDGSATSISEPPAETGSAALGDDAGHSAAGGHGAEPAAEPVAEPVAEPATVAWPRPWDPQQSIDFSGVEGVTPEQEARAEALAASTLEKLPQFADVATIPALGFQSIGDAATGVEHYINIAYIQDESFLDPTKPESLVYAVDGDKRTLVSAMFMARKTAVDDPALLDYGGPLMTWHNHENLCWALDEAGKPKVVGVTDAAGNCAAGSVNAGGDNPMVHVWIAPHECGPFAALEGHGAGQAGAGERTDQCTDGASAAEGTDHGEHEAAAANPVPYDPTKPIDLSGVDGVTPEQQAFAENIVAVNVVQLPQWSDPAVAEAAGFRSIGDAGTGHEHYINWAWIDDDVWLDPDAPESLVFEPQPDGSKKLVSAMYMLPTTMALKDVPDYGGQLMQWHIHDDLCFTDDPVAPQVGGLRPANGACGAPLVVRAQAPMIHVWIAPNKCGPFAALEGVGAGTVQTGEERWCDQAHG